MPVRGIRGAIQAGGNTPEAIYQATRELLCALLDANPSVMPEDVASVFFTVTRDLNASYPAKAARDLGWGQVPLLCAQEIPVPGELCFIIRVLLHWNTGLPQSAIRPVYLGAAASLRPDIGRHSL